MIRLLFLVLSLLPLARCGDDEDMGRIWIPRAARNEIHVGDSLTHGTGSTFPGGATAYPAYRAAALKLAPGEMGNLGVPSLGVRDLPDVDYRLKPHVRNRLHIMIAFNDLYNAGRSAVEAANDLAPYVVARTLSGWRCTLYTLTGQFFDDPGEDAIVDAYNNILRSTYSSSLVDVAADPHIGLNPPSTSPWFAPDSIHLSNIGYQRLGVDLAAPVGPPPGGAPTIIPAFGIVQDSHLKLWLRDWWEVSAADPAEEITSRWFNLAAGTILSRYVAASGTFAKREFNVINGRPAAHFRNNTRYITNGESWADYITPSAFTFEIVGIINSVSSVVTASYQNHGLISDTNNYVGLFLKSDGSGGALAQLYVYDGAVKETVPVAVPVGVPFRLSARLSSGQLGVSVNGGAYGPSEVACGNVQNLTGALQIGVGPTGAVHFDGWLSDVRVYDNVDGTRATSNATSDDDRYNL